MAASNTIRSPLAIASHSASSTFKRALNSYQEPLSSLEQRRKQAETVGRFFVLFKPQDLEGLETAGHETIKNFVILLFSHKYRVMFEVPKGSPEPKEYKYNSQLRLQWVFDETEDYKEFQSPLKHAYRAFRDTFARATVIYDRELHFIEQQRKIAETDSRFSFTITLGNVGELGNSEEKKIIGFILLLKAHGYGVKYVIQDGEETPSGYDSNTRLMIEMLVT